MLNRCLLLSVPAILIATLARSAFSARSSAIEVVEQLRLLRELPPLISDLRGLDGKMSYTPSRDPKTWSGYDSSAQLLRTQTKAFADHVEQDLRGIEGIKNDEDRTMVVEAAPKISHFSATLTDNVEQLAGIVGRLRRMTVEPGSWTLQGYTDALAAYKKSKQALDAEGGGLIVAFEKLEIGRSNWSEEYNFSCIYFGAAGFWCCLLLLLVCPGLREPFTRIFSLPKPSNQAVIKPFDALRGFSALWVAISHFGSVLGPLGVFASTSTLISNGNKAVPIFVAMSAFLIFRTVAKIDSWRDWGAYFKRRWLRIYPLYFAILVAILLCGHFPSIAQLGWKRVAAEFLMLRVAGYPDFLNPPAWSLYVEEGFYLLIPVWFLVFRKHIGLGVAVSYIAFSFLSLRHPDSREADLLRYFCVGILLTQFIDRPQGTGEAIKWLALLVGVALFSLAIARPFDIGGEIPKHLLAVSIFCLLWAAANVRRINKLLSPYPLRFLGIISYSMYMWHWLILTIGMPIRCVGPRGSITVYTWFSYPFDYHPAAFYLIYPAALTFYAAASYALIERPFLLLRRNAMPVSATKSE
ncbi:MAG: acyltransferase family protein [Elusimicrobiota bacterium]